MTNSEPPLLVNGEPAEPGMYEPVGRTQEYRTLLDDAYYALRRILDTSYRNGDVGLMTDVVNCLNYMPMALGQIDRLGERDAG